MIVVIYADNGEVEEVINPGIDALLQRRSKGGDLVANGHEYLKTIEV
jgi:hypothetical protein